MFYEDNYHANNNDNNDLNEKSKSHNKHKLLNPNFLTYKKAFNQKWKDGKYYKNINIDCYKSGTQGSIIYNAVTGYNTSHYVGSKDEHIYYNVTDCSGKFSKDRISLYYDSPEQYENHQYEILPTNIKEAWYKKNIKPVV